MAAKSRAQKASRVSRVPPMPPVKSPGPGPVNASADLAENRAPRRGAGPARVGESTPVPPRGRGTSVPDTQPGVRDLAAGKTGLSLFQRVASNGRRRKSGG
jgi:hypothetical protein